MTDFSADFNEDFNEDFITVPEFDPENPFAVEDSEGSIGDFSKDVAIPDAKPLMRFDEEIDYLVARSQLPDGYKHKDMEILVGLVQLVWLESNRRATLDEIVALTGWSRTKVIAGLSSKPLYWRLRKRGIDWPKKWKPSTSSLSELTPQQLMVIQVLTDPTRTEPFKKRLAAAGINYNVYRNWMRNPKFADAMRVISEDMITDNIATVHNSLVSKAERGDTQAMKLFYEVSGRHDPMRQQVLDMTKIVGLLLEVLTRHVTDTTVLARIQNDFSKVMSGDSVAPVGELEAFRPDDIEDAEVIEDDAPVDGFFEL